MVESRGAPLKGVILQKWSHHARRSAVGLTR